MKPSEYVRLFDGFKNWKFDRSKFELLLLEDFELILESKRKNRVITTNKDDAKITYSEFKLAVKEFQNYKWNKIWSKVTVNYKKVELYWKYIYATLICTKRNAMFPEIAKLHKPSEPKFRNQKIKNI